MLEYRLKIFNNDLTVKWKKVLFKSLRITTHLNFNIYTYKNGHKIYTASSKEIRDLYKKEKEQYYFLRKLNV